MIKEFHVAIGSARAEGRAPSHDGEYLAVYYRQGIANEWIVEDNAGSPASHLHTLVDAAVDADANDEQLAEMQELDDEIRKGVRCGDGDVSKYCGSEALDTMIEWGWITKEQTDGNHLLQ